MFKTFLIAVIVANFASLATPAGTIWNVLAIIPLAVIFGIEVEKSLSKKKN